jgi:carbonyl reductase 1
LALEIIIYFLDKAMADNPAATPPFFDSADWLGQSAGGEDVVTALLVAVLVLLLTVVAVRRIGGSLEDPPGGNVSGHESGTSASASDRSAPPAARTIHGARADHAVVAPGRRLAAPSAAQLAQPVVVVVGASRGLGLETVKTLACPVPPVPDHDPGGAQPYTVVLTARTLASGRAAITSITQPSRANVLLYAPLDIRKADHRQDFVGWLREAFPNQGIAAVILNAGVADQGKKTDAETAQRVIDTNFLGTVSLLSELTLARDAPRFANGIRFIVVTSRRGRRSIVTGAALAEIDAAAAAESPAAAVALATKYMAVRGSSVDGWPTSDVYGVSKLLLVAAVMATANAVRRSHPEALVVSVCPGWCRTDMGTAMAPRSAIDGAKSIASIVTLPSLETGRMYSDAKVVSW